MTDKYKQALIFFAIIAVAVFFRFYRLESIPPGLYPDVAINGNDAINSLKTGQFKLFYPENNGREGLMIWLDAFSFSLLGVSVYALKFPSALAGVLTVIGIYLLGRELFGKKQELVPYLASFFLAVSFWHVNFSRIGFRAILTPLCLVFAFYFFTKGFRTKRNFWQIPAGLFFGTGFYTYTGFRLAVPLLFCVMAGWFFYYWRGKLPINFLRAAVLMLATVFIVALPIGFYFLNNPGDFIGRAGQTSVFSSDNPLFEFVRSSVLHLGMFNIYGDGNWRHNYAGSPQLFWPIGLLFLIGLFIAFKSAAIHFKTRDFGPEFNAYLLLLAWFAFMLLPGTLTKEGAPHALRVIGTVPAVFLLAGLGSQAVYEKAKKKWSREVALALMLVFCVIAAGHEYCKYFLQWSSDTNIPEAFTEVFVNEGKLLSDLSANTKTIAIVNEPGVPVPYPNGIPMPAQTIIFTQLADCFEHNGFYNPACDSPYSRFLLPASLNEIKINERTIIMPMKYDPVLLKSLKQRFPEGNLKFERDIQYYEIF